LKVVWSAFQSLDATIKIPLLILWVWQFVNFCILCMLCGYPYITLFTILRIGKEGVCSFLIVAYTY
jgi:hypothetical protein